MTSNLRSNGHRQHAELDFEATYLEIRDTWEERAKALQARRWKFLRLLAAKDDEQI